MKLHQYYIYSIRAGVTLVVCMVLSACSFSKSVAKNPTQELAEQQHSLLVPWQIIQGGLQRPTPTASAANRYLLFGRPVAVAVLGNDLYVADAGRSKIFRYDLSRQILEPFYSLSSRIHIQMYAAQDHSLYVTDNSNKQVLQLDINGRVLRRLRDINLGQPVAVVEDLRHGQILIADGLYTQVLSFNRLGRFTGVIRPRDKTGQYLLNITDMAIGPDGLYLLDMLQRQVVVTNRRGEFLYSFGADSLQQPLALSVDAENRVFVADGFSNSIKVFFKGRVIEPANSTALAQVNHITDIYLHEGWLYITDDVGARVAIMRVNPGIPTKEDSR